MDAGRAPASGLDGSNRYADTLKRYRLYDCSGVIRPLSDGEMRSWFERWRGTRGKRVTVARTVTQNSLNQAWASFVDCWSEETGAVFRETIVARGATHARMSVGHCQQGLRALVELRPNLYYVHFLEGCRYCRGYDFRDNIIGVETIYRRTPQSEPSKSGSAGTVAVSTS
ncbi:hypothetical protein GQ600_26879 [Phytophthora cactorum]|nr:hypothetical protein GQ600_26879 [Phytophthora cactorum]